MNRAERDSFVATTDQENLAHGESACLETPPELFAALHEEFQFDVDLTANEWNHLLPTWFGPNSPTHDSGYNSYQDALDCDWSMYNWVCSGFSNPPYGEFISKILAKAVLEQQKGFTSVFLLPMRVNTAFKEIILRHATELRFVDERIKFWYQGKPKPSARVKWAKKFEQVAWADKRDGYVIDTRTGQFILAPAGALFDSIVVVFRGWALRQTGLPLPFGPRVSVWHWNKDRHKRAQGKE